MRQQTKVSEYIRWSYKYRKDSGDTGKSDGDFLAEMRKANPEQFADKPELEEPDLERWEVEYVEAFYMLTHSRQSGMGVGSIPLSEIIIYCDFFDVDEPKDFIKIIQSADNAYLEEHGKAQDKEK